jgi:lambda family phage portal protein
MARSRKQRKLAQAARRSSGEDLPVVAVNTLPAATPTLGYWHGEKYPGGLGPAEILSTDYWTLRHRSAALFKSNLYARGLIRRIIDNEISTGLHLEASPEEGLLGYPDDGLAEWTETVENRFALWCNAPRLCDFLGANRFGKLQEFARREALICGDILVVLHQDDPTGLPKVQLVNGSKIQTPLRSPSKGTRIEHGVELDTFGRHVAYWVQQDDGSSRRITAYGERTGRRVAWLVYGTDMRLDDVRGEPLLSLVVQSLKEIDRYRDSTQRKATINSMLAMFIKKTEDKPGTRPITSGAVRRGLDTAADSTGTARSFRTMEMMPGLVIDELAVGEEPQGFLPNGTDEKFGDFEAAILAGIAFANGVPPEIYRLFFSNNYSASQAAINEFKMVLDKNRTDFGAQFCSPIYEEWLVSEVLKRRVSAQGLLEAWRDPERFDVYEAWIQSDWSGHIKPAVDLSKLVNGYAAQIKEGLNTRSRVTRELSGQRYSKVIKQLARENAQWAKAMEPVQRIENPAPEPVQPESSPDDERETNGTTTQAIGERPALRVIDLGN